MSTLYITEFTEQGTGSNQQLAVQPPVAEQTVAISGSTTQSSAFGNRTVIVRLHTDSICSIEFGANPTATATKARMAANQTEYFLVPMGMSWKVAVISNS